MKMVAPWTRFYSNSCCLCCHVRTGTILLGVWYLIINAVVLLILLSALADPDQYHFSSSELGGDFEFMDDANMCIAIAISLLMILICAMATYGAYKQHAAWIIPFFCYQIFDFALNTLVAITILVYPNSIQEYIRQLTATDTSMAGIPPTSWFMLPAMTLRCCCLRMMRPQRMALPRSRRHLTCLPRPGSGHS
uniref:Lysosomal-associated transmembrane protein 4B n=1 Tax=Sus scrofa TaxID=9823 RepID=A0A8D1CI11_PIG